MPQNPFTQTGALSLRHPLFRGREAELARLEQASLYESDFYLLVYGGRQNGKTSLLLRLEDRLRTHLEDGVRVCRVDFQGLPSATSGDAYQHLARRVATVLPQTPVLPTVPNADALSDFLEQALSNGEVQRLVLLIDELGVLPERTRKDLAHVVRSLHTRRLDGCGLTKLQVVLAGATELYDLAVVEASTLRNVCEIVRLGDLSEGDATALLRDGLSLAGVAPERASELGSQVYARVHGHPYLTQRIGSLFADACLAGRESDDLSTDAACWELIQGDDPLLGHLRQRISDLDLMDAARRLLAGNDSTTRTSDALARLELLGVARAASGRWRPRSPVFTVAMAEWVGMDVPHVLSVLQAASDVRQQALGEHLSDIRREQAATEQRAPQATTAAEETRLRRRASDLASEIRRLEAAQQVRPAWVPEMIHVPAGPFVMGSNYEDGFFMYGVNEIPRHRLLLSDYWIGKTPVTNAQFRPFVEGDGYTNAVYWTEVGWDWCKVEMLRQPAYWSDDTWNGANYPVVGISWFEAVAYCRWLSARTGDTYCLPSEAEWEKAARGPDGRIWPWGNRWEDGRCNSEEAEKGRTTPVDAYPQGASPYGALDMAGNVWEWCATTDDKPYPYKVEDEWWQDALEQDAYRRLRGGAWEVDLTKVRGAYRNGNFPRYCYILNGLRVASHSLRNHSESEACIPRSPVGTASR